MSLCSCPEMPVCEWDWCTYPADWSILQPPWGKSRGARAKFMCDWHAETYRKAMTTPIRGCDRPEGADEDWRGSIIETVRHAQIAIAFEERNKRP